MDSYIPEQEIFPPHIAAHLSISTKVFISFLIGK